MLFLLWDVGWFSLQHFEFWLLLMSALPAVTETTANSQQLPSVMHSIRQLWAQQCATSFFWSGCDFSTSQLKFFIIFIYKIKIIYYFFSPYCNTLVTLYWPASVTFYEMGSQISHFDMYVIRRIMISKQNSCSQLI
jgi:hypothetical protein